MNKTNILFLLALGVSLGVSLSACGGVKESLGLNRKAPDEFAVVKRAPLAMPPDYALRPPRPGAPRPQEQATSQQARQAVFGGEEPQPVSNAKTDGESLLLQKAGGNAADPNIRRKVDKETASLQDRNVPVAKKLLGLGGAEFEPSATVVDQAAEAERLRENAEQGKPVTEGETPSIDE